MCTYILRYDPDSDWPFLIAGNRDELRTRPWLPPARHWSDREDVVAGQDTLAGGTWLGVSDTGVVAAILNKKKALGPAPNKRSRGEIVLDALDHADAVDAAKAMADANGDAYRPFNLIVADNRDAFWIAHEGDAQVRVSPSNPVCISSVTTTSTRACGRKRTSRVPVTACRKGRWRIRPVGKRGSIC